MKKILLLPIMALSLIGCQQTNSSHVDMSIDWTVIKENQELMVRYGENYSRSYSPYLYQKIEYRWETYSNLPNMLIEVRVLKNTNEKEIDIFNGTNISYVLLNIE